MKKGMLFLSTMLMIVGAIVSCEKPDNKQGGEENKDGDVPTLTIAADAAFNADMKANITLTLSAAAAKDVEVKLAKGTIESGKSEIAADFNKKVVIPAGETTKKVEVSADAMGLESGEYQAAIKVESAEGAKVAENAVVYINYSFVYTPAVDLHADSQFASDKTAKLTISLAKATSKDVKVKLATDPASTATVSYESEVTIPAGETSKDVTVTVEVPENLAAGVYPAIIKVESAENGEVGTSASVTINLVYPFEIPITLDGLFDDWNNPAVVTATLPDGAFYPDMKVMKLAATSTYVYVYLEFTDPGFDSLRPFDMFVDNDGDPATGYALTSIDNDTVGDIFTSYGGKWYIELSLHDGDHFNDFHSWGGIYRFDGTDGAGVFSGGLGTIGAFEASMMCAEGGIEDGVGRLEIQLNREKFGMTGQKARFGVKIMDGANNWKALGVLPQAVEGGAFKPADMLAINLPAYAQ